MRAALRFCLIVPLTCAAWGQVRRIDVYTPEPILVVGTETALAVTTRDTLENVMIGAAVQYRSSQPTIVSVDAAGLLRALRPGQSTITVTSGSVSSTVEVLAAPRRIQVDPEVREIFVGEKLQFTATAFDAQERPIPNVAFSWSVTGANGGQINAATINASGLLSALGTSSVTVRANLNYASRADRFPPQFIGFARTEIRHKSEYRIARLASTEDVRSGFAMRRVLANIAGNDRGQFVFRGSLDGTSTCVVLFDNGRFDCVASAGEPRPLGGNIVTPFGQPAINNRGDILYAASGIGLALATRDGTRYPIQDGAFFGDYVMAGGFAVAKRSLNDGGDILFAFNFRRTSNNAVTLRGLARLAEGEPEFVWTSEQPLAGLNGTISLEDWGIDGNGVVWLQAAGSGGGRALYRAERFQPPQRIFGIGDANEGSTVNGVSSLQVSESGAVAFYFTRQNGSQAIARHQSGKTETLRITGSPAGPLSIHSASGVAFRGDTGSGYGIYRWNGSDVTQVAPRSRNAPNGETVSSINAAHINVAGEVLAQVSTGVREFAVYNASSNGPILVQTSADMPVSARLHLPVSVALVPGEKSGPLRLRLGDVRSLYELGADGKLSPRLVDLDMLPDSSRFFGVGDSFEAQSGEVLFASNGTLFRNDGTKTEIILRNQTTADDGSRLNFNAGTRAVVNASGVIALVAQTQTAERRIYIYRGGQLQQIGVVSRTTVAEGDIITAVRNLAIDGAGRVMAFLDVRGATAGLYLFDGSQWRAVAVPGVNTIGDLPVRDVRAPLAAGSSFFTVVTRGTGAQTLQSLVEYKSDRFSVVMQPGDALPQGNAINTFGVFDTNERGDIAFWANGNTSGASGLMLRTADGNLRLVHQLVRPVVPGDYIVSVSEVDLRGDGTIYWGSMTIRDAYSIFKAEPAR